MLHLNNLVPPFPQDRTYSGSFESAMFVQLQRIDGSSGKAIAMTLVATVTGPIRSFLLQSSQLLYFNVQESMPNTSTSTTLTVMYYRLRCTWYRLLKGKNRLPGVLQHSRGTNNTRCYAIKQELDLDTLRITTLVHQKRIDQST